MENIDKLKKEDVSDFNQTNQSVLPGFEEYPEMKTSIIPDFNQVASKKLGTQMEFGFDPHALMIKKKEVNSGEVQDTTPKQEWPEKDVKALEDFCKQQGVLGFNCGKTPPIIALTMLKQQMGVVDGPIDNRIPSGYEKFGVKPMIYNQNYPYTAMVKQKTSSKTLLNG